MQSLLCCLSHDAQLSIAWKHFFKMISFVHPREYVYAVGSASAVEGSAVRLNLPPTPLKAG